jgi:hypothetical protein
VSTSSYIQTYVQQTGHEIESSRVPYSGKFTGGKLPVFTGKLANYEITSLCVYGNVRQNYKIADFFFKRTWQGCKGKSPASAIFMKFDT